MDNLTQLRLLLIEDNPDDALLVLHAIRDAGFVVYERCIETEQALREALAEGGWDVVISDYSLPQFNGLKALEIVRALDSEIPFLFVSGTVRDEVGIKAMEAGANDYLLKSNLARLGPALRREIGEAQLRRMGRVTEAQYEAILDGASDGIISVDEQSRLILFNRSAEAIFGYTEEEILGQSLCRLLPEGVADRHQQLMDAFGKEDKLQLQGGVARPLVGRRKNGEEFPAEISVSRTRVDGCVTYTAIIRDVTDRKALEEALKRHSSELEDKVAQRTEELELARQDAERLAQAKSEFLANMSHEIRNPMNAVLGLAYVLCRMDLPDEAAELAQKIHNSGQILLGILNDVLDFSKIEAGRLDIDHSPFYLGDVLDNLATIMATSAAGKGLELIIKPPPFHACHLVGDALRVEQILINLTSNAIKFTQEGLVEVRIDLLEQDGQQARLRFSVRDTGLGIDTATQTRLFSPFVQADTSTTRRFGGTGLGLAICRRLLKLMDSDMRLESIPGHGSTFSFSLDFEKQQNAQALMHEMLDVRVLIADDNPASLAGMGATVASVGWIPEMFGSGRALLDRVMGGEDIQNPHTVLLVDRHMPGMDGVTVIRSLCSQLPRASRPIMLLVSGHQLEDDREACDCGEVDCTLTKPLGPSMLYNAVVRARARHQSSLKCPVISTPEAGRLNGLRILVVDDSDVNRLVAEDILKEEGAEIHLAEDGLRALEWLKEHPCDVDVVLMDVNMPVMDGLEATRRIRTIPQLAALPVLALTAGVIQEQKDAAREAGMNGFISKPFEVEKAVALLKEILCQAEKPGVTPVENSKPDPVHSPEAGTRQLLNESYGLSVFRSREKYERYLNLFVEHYHDCHVQLKSLLNDRGALGGLAHRLRGAAANLGLEQVADVSALLENASRSGLDVVGHQQRLQEVLMRTLQTIASYVSPVKGVSPRALTPASTEWLEARLKQLRNGLADFSLDDVEPVLIQLEWHLPHEQLEPLADAMERFDFSEAESSLRQLAAQLGICLE